MVSRALQRSEPAYSGARFDAKGMCIFHSDVRLCKVKDDGKFQIVKKTCFKCGTAGLIVKDCHKAKTRVHGYKAKGVPKRQQLADKLQGLSSRNLDPKTDEQRPLESKDSKGSSKGRSRRQKKTQTRGEQRPPTSRSRTLSPLRPKAQRSPKPTSTGRGRRREMYDPIEYPIPPLPLADTARTGIAIAFTPTSRKHGNTGACVYAKSNKIQRDDRRTDLPGSTSREIKVEKISNGFGFGHCSIHPHVRLAIIRSTRGDGNWDIRKESCPLCPATRGKSETFGDNAPPSCLPTTSESSSKPSGTTFVRCSSGPSTTEPLALAPQSPNDVTDVGTCLALVPLRNSNTRIANRKKNKERAERENAPWPVPKHVLEALSLGDY